MRACVCVLFCMEKRQYMDKYVPDYCVRRGLDILSQCSNSTTAVGVYFQTYSPHYLLLASSASVVKYTYATHILCYSLLYVEAMARYAPESPPPRSVSSTRRNAGMDKYVRDVPPPRAYLIHTNALPLDKYQ